METKLLDSAHGWNGDGIFVLEQYWLVDGEEPVKITVRYCVEPGMHLYSTAELVYLDEEDVNPEVSLRLHAYPSQWWQEIGLESRAYEAAPPLLEEVATGLLVRFVTLIEAVAEAAQN